jgi:hypothetical protein
MNSNIIFYTIGTQVETTVRSGLTLWLYFFLVRRSSRPFVLAELRGSQLLEKCGREKMGRGGRWVKRWKRNNETGTGCGSHGRGRRDVALVLLLLPASNIDCCCWCLPWSCYAANERFSASQTWRSFWTSTYSWRYVHIEQLGFNWLFFLTHQLRHRWHSHDWTHNKHHLAMAKVFLIRLRSNATCFYLFIFPSRKSMKWAGSHLYPLNFF